MATAVLELERGRSSARVRAASRPRHVPYENLVMFTLALAFYIAAAAYFVFHLNYMINDAVTRVDNAFDVLFTRDPHLGAIGFFWGPLPSFFDLPIIAFKGVWPPLANHAFAGSIEAALFSAGTVVVFNSALRWAGVVRGMRWIICLIWAVNPMVVIFGAQGMSEAPFMFFFVSACVAFLRWAESGRTALLPLAGILAGAGALCRNEAVLIAVVMGVAVIVMSVRRRPQGGWRQVETEALLYGLPAVFVLLLWLGTAAILLHDPLYLVHATGLFGGGGAAQVPAPAAVSTQVAPGAAHNFVSVFVSAASVVISHCVLMFPAVLGFLALLSARLFVKGDRLPGVFLAIFGALTPAVDIWFNARGYGPFLFLRYQIVIIPYTFLIAVFVLRSLRQRAAIFSSWIALGMAVLLGFSNIVTAMTLSNPTIAPEEAPLVQALATGQPVQGGGDYGVIYGAEKTVADLNRLDTDHGIVLCDSAACFALNLVARDPKMFLVTSDRTFEAALAQPKEYGVEYFLVSNGANDRLNNTYPGLWEDGAGFSSYVGETGGYRLYRITGDTGRGA